MKIRWIDTSCFEIVSDEGDVIVTDPFIDECETATITSDDVGKMDYILITHTHFDHITQVDKYFELYRPKILCSVNTADRLLEAFDLSGQLLYGMDHRESLDFGNTRFTRIAAKHSIPGRADRHFVRESRIGFPKVEGDDGRIEALNRYGYMDFSNFYMETANNTRILFWGGGLTHEQMANAHGFHPDIILMQIPSNPIESIIELVKMTGASYVIPHHQDSYYKTKDVAKMMEEYKAKLEEACPSTKYVTLKRGEWYRFEKKIEKES